MFGNSGGLGFNVSFVDRGSVFVDSLADWHVPSPWSGSLPLCPLIFSWCYDIHYNIVL